jgi:hypothetical protein
LDLPIHKYLSFLLLLLLLSHQAPAQPAAGAFGKGSAPDDRERERGAGGGSSGLFRGVFGTTNSVIPSSEDAEDLHLKNWCTWTIYRAHYGRWRQSACSHLFDSTIANDGVALSFEAKVTHVAILCIEAVTYLQGRYPFLTEGHVHTIIKEVFAIPEPSTTSPDGCKRHI